MKPFELFFRPSLPALLAALAITGCGPAADSDSAADEVAQVADGLVCFTSAGADELAERPSPLDSAMTAVGGAEVKVCYGSPASRDREIMGAVVPFGQPWRFGANEATAIHLEEPTRVGGVELPAGSYSLFAVPDVDSWTVVLNGNFQRWGIPLDASIREADVGSFAVTPETLDTPVESLTMRFEDGEGAGAELVVEWELTRLRIPVQPVEG